ncbi:lysozyme-like [Aricia agestis]|uniref:lysozyme-like n=1 Tax=Aricia agestis TaxID=91739 RepID=UPI001C20731D|nr:lysozyme-like [Aricia agestis]
MKIILLFLYVFVVDAKKFTRCRLAKELVDIKLFQKTFLGNWVCLIEQVSDRDTSALKVSPSGKKSYGLYQIPSKWCKEGKKGGDCNIACESLLDDDIRDDTACAVTIFNKEGFKYWNQWTTRCKKNIDFITREIYKCPGLIKGRSNRRKVSPVTDLPSEELKNRRKQTKNGIDRRIGNR